MRILFSMRHPGALRNFSSTVTELARRGHQIYLVFVQQDKWGDGRLLWDITQNYTNVTYGQLTKKSPARFWLTLARGVRYCIDYTRYFTPEYESVTSLKRRAGNKTPGFFRILCRMPLFKTRIGNRALLRLMLAVERAIPVDRLVTDVIALEKPDVVLVTPLVDLGSDQVDYIKSARYLGIRSALCVHSWDNLTNKGLIRIQPDRVCVWNETQKTEAVTMHGTRAEDVVVTGAMVYDQWFDRQPTTTRADFCAQVGLNCQRPFFLYLCSSQFIAPDEVSFVEQWVKAVRSAADPAVRQAGILIRPHPENTQPWQRIDDLNIENVAVWPRAGANPVDAASKNGFFDSMFHSAGAVGINTSAQIECGIVGRPVFAIRTPDYAGTQEGTLHFHYLLNDGGGLLYLADSFDEHTTHLAQALRDPEGTRQKVRGFVASFTRPHGLESPATPRMADAIEQLAALPKRVPERMPLHLYPLRFALYPVALLGKLARLFDRVSKRRQQPRRPLTRLGYLVQPFQRMLDGILRWTPAKTFARRYIVPRVVPRMGQPDAPSEEGVAVPRMLHKMSRTDRPIVVGPWLSEVGFEVLYWIPFLNWVKTYRPFDPARLVVVSRGGAGLWYRDIGARYIDLFDHFTPEEYQRRNEQRFSEGKQKQRDLSDFDRDVLSVVRETLNVQEVDLIHPMFMYRLFYPYWKSQRSVNLIEEFAVFRPLPVPESPELNGALPDDFIAMRFYFNDAFPETDDNRRFVRTLIENLAESTDIVMLNPGLKLDDHWDLRPSTSSRVHSVAHLMTPRNNLEVQTKIITRARAFVGTYGGLSYLPPFYGTSSLAFYSESRAFVVQHLELARRVFSDMKRGSYVVLDVNDLDMVQLALGERNGALAGPASRDGRGERTSP